MAIYRWARLAFAATAILGLVRCGESEDKLRPVTALACTDGGRCVGGDMTFATPDAGRDVSDSGSGQTATLTASVIRFADTSFQQSASSVFPGPAEVTVPVPSGQQSYSIGADAGPEFTADVLVGTNWFRAVPASNADLYTTLSYLSVARGQQSLSVPVIDRTLLSTLFASVSVGISLDSNAAQLIFVFSRANGTRASGVRITSSQITAGAYLYDTGPGGNYVADSTSTPNLTTGELGVIVAANVSGGSGTFQYTFNGSPFVTPAVTFALKQATFVPINVGQ